MINEIKYVTIDNNQFIYDDEYISFIENRLQRKEFSPKSNHFYYRWINKPKIFELPERELIKKYLSDKAIVLELGGYIGTTACLINNITENKELHTVSEIDAFFRLYLNKNKILNNCKFNIIDKIEYLDESMVYNTIISDIEGDEYLFILNNQEYIKKHIKLLIIEFHSTYTCKKNKPIGQKTKKNTYDFLNYYFKKIDSNHNTNVYVKYE